MLTGKKGPCEVWACSLLWLLAPTTSWRNFGLGFTGLGFEENSYEADAGMPVSTSTMAKHCAASFPPYLHVRSRTETNGGGVNRKSHEGLVARAVEKKKRNCWRDLQKKKKTATEHKRATFGGRKGEKAKKQVCARGLVDDHISA